MAITGLVVGLGNPGPSYAGTRHNIGFQCTDALRDAMIDVASLSGAKFHCLLWKVRFQSRNEEWLVANPQTFMNRSGDCVQPLAAWHRIAPEQILVVHDELDLPAGRMKFKCGGGDAGHNGLKSITQRLGTPNYYRLRIGCGRPERGDVVNWVLGRPSPDESAAILSLFPTGCDCIRAFSENNPEHAAKLANGYRDSSPTA